jgi:division protein CdvB (Snf7/Vps24/ESCRT-III family)
VQLGVVPSAELLAEFVLRKFDCQMEAA